MQDIKYILKRYFKLNNLLDDLSNIKSSSGIKYRLNGKGTNSSDKQTDLTDNDKDQLTGAINKLIPMVEKGLDKWENEKVVESSHEKK